MDKENLLLEIPYGMRDFLPQEATAKRAVESRLAEIFAAWGYEEVVTPVMEFLDTLVMGSGNNMEEHMFKFVGRDNRTLALRHEMTTPIARLVTGRLREEPFPLKLFYISSVYRHEEVQTGRRCEFYQAGVELVGQNSSVADAEILTLATACLSASGIPTFRLNLGHVGFAGGILASCGLTAGQRKKIQHIIENKNLVKLREYTDKLPLSDSDKEILRQIPLLCGGKDVLERGRSLTDNPQSLAALDNLAQIYALCEHYGREKNICFDLGLIRDFNYYTGMVFEIYVPTLGFPVCGGGRYDDMLTDFGRKAAATGFALGIERLMLAMGGGLSLHSAKRKDVYVAYATEEKIVAAIAKSDELRRTGQYVCQALAPQTRDEAEITRRTKGYERLVYVG